MELKAIRLEGKSGSQAHRSGTVDERWIYHVAQSYTNVCQVKTRC
jgi:hypothetical protein